MASSSLIDVIDELTLELEDEIEEFEVTLANPVYKGENGDCNFATFEIVDGKLIATFTKDNDSIKFDLLSNGHLEVYING